MAIFQKESLEKLRDRVDLIEVISSHIPLQRSGAYYKACCPFHEEKSPSFVVQSGDKHYHCFGCSAHGDAISFLMGHLKLSFKESALYLSEKFQIPLELAEEDNSPTINKKPLKEALQKAARFFHFCLLHTGEGHSALQYLYDRGIDLAFIERFQLGFSLKGNALKSYLLKLGYSEDTLLDAGLLQSERRGDFFQNRVMIPIQDPFSQVIGFTARKIEESTFGGKYINTSETPLFKKSQVLFGLNYCRSRIAKERKALIVEGQIDALRLIQEGFDFTVAGQGTAFGEAHVKELMQLGVNEVYLALDSDHAGVQAAIKIGHLFQKKGVGVRALILEGGKDPDSFLREKGKEAFNQALEASIPYLEFVYKKMSEEYDVSIPTQKNAIVEQMAKRIKEWEHPVLIHESLKTLAKMADIPESTLGIRGRAPSTTSVSSKAFSKLDIEGDKILEIDLLRWLMLALQQGSEEAALIVNNLEKEDFKYDLCRSLFNKLTHADEKNFDMLSLGHLFSESEMEIVDEIMTKRINRQKMKEGVLQTLEKLLKRVWMDKREMLTEKIKESHEEEQLSLSKTLAELIKNVPSIKTIS